MNTWEIASRMGYRPRAFGLLAAYHQSVHVQLAAIMAASIGPPRRLATGAAAA